VNAHLIAGASARYPGADMNEHIRDGDLNHALYTHTKAGRILTV